MHRGRQRSYDYEGRSVRLERDLILRGEQVFDAQVGFDPDSDYPRSTLRLIVKAGSLCIEQPVMTSVGEWL